MTNTYPGSDNPQFVAWLNWQARLLDSQARFEPIDVIYAKWLANTERRF